MFLKVKWNHQPLFTFSNFSFHFFQYRELKWANCLYMCAYFTYNPRPPLRVFVYGLPTVQHSAPLEQLKYNVSFKCLDVPHAGKRPKSPQQQNGREKNKMVTASAIYKSNFLPNFTLNMEAIYLRPNVFFNFGYAKLQTEPHFMFILKKKTI